MRLLYLFNYGCWTLILFDAHFHTSLESPVGTFFHDLKKRMRKKTAIKPIWYFLRARMVRWRHVHLNRNTKARKKSWGALITKQCSSQRGYRSFFYIFYCSNTKKHIMSHYRWPNFLHKCFNIDVECSSQPTGTINAKKDAPIHSWVLQDIHQSS